MDTFVQFLVAVGRRWWALMSCAIFTGLGIYVAYANKSNEWAVKTSFAAAVVCLFIACFLAWREELIRAEDAKSQVEEVRHKYLDERPQLGLEILGPQGPTAWQNAKARDACWFWLQQLSGRTARSIRFDPIPSKRGRFTLHFDEVPFLEPPPRRTPLTYHVREVGVFPPSAHDMEKIGDIEGKMLGQFLDDSPPELIELRYILISRFRDRENEERTRNFNIVFNKSTLAFLPNTHQD